MKKTSLTHPLHIAVISAGSEFGRVGITFCPGKYDLHAMSGEWDRDLALDLDTVRDWGAAAVVTLLESKELTLLRVERLGEEVLRRNMLWFHLPIVDVSISDQRFDEKWDAAGEELHSILRNGPGRSKRVHRKSTSWLSLRSRNNIRGHGSMDWFEKLTGFRETDYNETR